MKFPNNLVTLHPYFQVMPGKLAEVRALLPEFVALTQTESACVFYEFTRHGETIFCREGYAGAAGVMAHLDNVGELLGKLLALTEVTRMELHGPAAELDALRGPLAHLTADFFVSECGIEH
jgi:quinol monooxygenase YgiN